jgi:hypothetical protein
MHPTIIFPAHYYADAALFASTEETRYYLNGVALTAAGHVVATDGHRMFVACPSAGTDPEKLAGWPAVDVILPLDKAILSAARKPAKNGTRFLVIKRDGLEGMRIDMAVIDAADAGAAADAHPNAIYATAAGMLVDGTFPSYEQAVPSSIKLEPATAALNSKYVGDLAKLTSAAANKCVTIHPTKDGGPLWIGLGREDAFALIMPMRSGTTVAGPPDWFHAGFRAAEKRAAA